MNLLLLEPADFISSEKVRLSGRRLEHIRQVHRAEAGKQLNVGFINGKLGTGTIDHIDRHAVEMHITLTHQPPPPIPLTVLLAVPRPKMLKRCLQHLSALGVKHIILMNSYRVEKSFWQSPWLNQEKIHEQLLLGLEQSKDTALPQVTKELRFKPFVEDRLPALVQNKRALIAHPGSGIPCPHRLTKPAVLAIGPEGGFIPYEVDKLQQAGFEAIHLGARILRVETAITALISKLYD